MPSVKLWPAHAQLYTYTYIYTCTHTYMYIHTCLCSFTFTYTFTPTPQDGVKGLCPPGCEKAPATGALLKESAFPQVWGQWPGALELASQQCCLTGSQLKTGGLGVRAMSVREQLRELGCCGELDLWNCGLPYQPPGDLCERR